MRRSGREEKGRGIVPGDHAAVAVGSAHKKARAKGLVRLGKVNPSGELTTCIGCGEQPPIVVSFPSRYPGLGICEPCATRAAGIFKANRRQADAFLRARPHLRAPRLSRASKGSR